MEPSVIICRHRFGSPVKGLLGPMAAVRYSLLLNGRTLAEHSYRVPWFERHKETVPPSEILLMAQSLERSLEVKALRVREKERSTE